MIAVRFEETIVLVTHKNASRLLCPFRAADCVGGLCAVWRWSKEVDANTGERFGWCGAGGQAGAWKEPIARACVARKEPVNARARARGPDEAENLDKASDLDSVDRRPI